MNANTNVVAGECSLDPLVRCWSCEGTGIACRAAMNTANVDIPCDRCKGSGECPEIMREWEVLGAAYRADRQMNGATLREWARKLNVGVVALSQAERGIIDPRSLHSANDGSEPQRGGHQ